MFLFYLEYVTVELAINYLEEFLSLVDYLRSAFDKLIWFKEYTNFTQINGEINSIVENGFIVKINSELINEKIEGTEFNTMYFSEEKYKYGFFNKRVFKYNEELFGIHSDQREDRNIENPELRRLLSNYNSFIISEVNYSKSNVLNIIKLVLADESTMKFVHFYGVKSLFLSLDLFLIKSAYSYLGDKSPKYDKKEFKSSLISMSSVEDYRIQFQLSGFWKLLKKYRPRLYTNIYEEEIKQTRIFDFLKRAYLEDTIVKGVVKYRTNGGLIVSIKEFDVFLPGSQVDRVKIENLDDYIGKRISAKVIKINEEIRNVVISRRVLKEKEFEFSRVKLMNKLNAGDILKGKVTNLTSYGAFVDIGGVVGLVHIRDISWELIDHPRDLLKIGEEIEVVVLQIENENEKIFFGLKQLKTNPWEEFYSNFKVGDIVEGIVLNKVDYGVFVTTLSGVIGLAHYAENPLLDRANVLIGDKLNCKILNFKTGEEKLSFYVCNLESKLWLAFTSRFNIGDVVEGEIVKIKSYGLFIKLDENLVGLLHRKNLPNSRKKPNLNSIYSINSKIRVKIIDFNKDRMHISLSKYVINSDHYSEGYICEGKVIEINKGTGIVEFNEEITGICPKRFMKSFNNTQLKLNYVYRFKILKKDEFKNTIYVAHCR